MKEIEDKLRWLAGEWKGLIIIQCNDKGWSLHTYLGNDIRFIHGTNCESIADSVDASIKKWINRSEDDPFVR